MKGKRDLYQTKAPTTDQMTPDHERIRCNQYFVEKSKIEIRTTWSSRRVQYAIAAALRVDFDGVTFAVIEQT